MFRWLNKQGVESDQGFVVQFTGRFTCEYRENNKILVLEIEDGFYGTQPCINVRRNAFEVWNGKNISLQQQQQIINNLKSALEFQGLKLVVD